MYYESDEILIAIGGFVAFCIASWFVINAVINKLAKKYAKPKKTKTTDEQILEELIKGNQEREDSHFWIRFILAAILLFFLLKNCGSI
tara:strand:- start:494 stop:757 length:264 start_codon:yes stop_codon:yes gene_type:complete